MHRIVKVIIYFNEQIKNYSEVSDAEISILSIQTQTIEFYCVLSLSIDKVPNLVLGLSAYINYSDDKLIVREPRRLVVGDRPKLLWMLFWWR